MKSETKRVLVVKKLVSTRRIYFRAIDEGDIDNGWLNWINDPAINKYLNYKKNVARTDLVQYLQESNAQSNYLLATCLSETNKYIGNARLHSIDWETKRASYGRLIGNGDFRGRGIGTEMLILLAYFSFYSLGLNKIGTGVIEKNVSSVRSNENAGAIREGIETQYISGKFETNVIFGMTKSGFDRTAWKEIVLPK